MKGIIIFFDDNNSIYKNEKCFDDKSAVNLSEEWAESLELDSFTISGNECTKLLPLLEKMKQIGSENKADFIVFTYNDLPFLKTDLTQKMLKNHQTYLSEYTFSDGYPYGFAPEIIDCGTLGILIELAKTTKSEFASKKITRDCIYEFIKSDINSFEVETVLAQEDWRLFRYSFNCGKKENLLQCKALFENLKSENISIYDSDAEELSRIASKNPRILKTVPGYYEIQIVDGVNTDNIYSPYQKSYEKLNGVSPVGLKSSENNLMDFENFSKIVEKAASFSENAVIGLSAFGEPLNHPDILKFIEKVLSYSGLSVFFETDGWKITDDFCVELKKIVEAASERTNGWEKVMIAVSVDGVSNEMYQKIKNPSGIVKNLPDLSQIQTNIQKLYAVIPGCVYPQFVRINENECELEAFFRFWNDKNNASGGKFIIEKYNDYSKLLPECKPADLSPLERNVCWKLRRNITIFTNGDVPLCKNCLFGCKIGNIFEEDLEILWKKNDSVLLEHTSEKYSKKCENCDEYYTFDF